MDLIFSWQFVTVLLVYSAVGVWLTDKAKSLVGVVGGLQANLIAFFVTGVVSYLSKFIGASTVFVALYAIGYVGDTPDVPAGATFWAYYVLIHIASFLVAGRIYDWRKLIKG